MAGGYIFGCNGTSLTVEEKHFFRDADPWGFILFARNLETPDQIRHLTAQLRETVGRDAVILIDQEGGRVARLRGPTWLDWLPALEQMALAGPVNGPKSMWIRSRLIADELLALGIDTNCAPIADVPTETVHAIIRNRCYGQSALEVVGAGRAVADGLLAGGVLPVLKHIPGHGRPVADSHLELPRTNAPLAELRATDFAAFKGLNDLPIGMTAHVVYDAVDPENCATLSAKVIDLIRSEIGFDGLLMTDDLSMQALSGSFAERATASISAGCDIVLHCHGVMGEMVKIATAAGDLGAKAAARANRALACRKPAQPIDKRALLAALAEMLMLPGNV